MRSHHAHLSRSAGFRPVPLNRLTGDADGSGGRRLLRIAGSLLVRVGCICLCTSAVLADESPSDQTTRSDPATVEFFERRVRPLLVRHCWKCHGESRQENNLRLDSREAILRGGDSGPAVSGGDPGASRLISAVRHDGELRMPPSGPLEAEEVEALKRWVSAGLPWPTASDRPARTGGNDSAGWAERSFHWSFQPVERPMLPAISNTGWPRTPVDHFILARLEAEGLSPAPPAEKAVLLRRVTFDLTGLPPTEAELESFLADTSPGAYERVVDRLLGSPRYGERWGRHWLDLVRFAETTGHEYDFDIPYVWRYRDYVIRAFNEDVPYDQFLVEHVAGDLLEQPRRDPATTSNESVLATAFWWFGQQKSAPVDLRAEECDQIDDQIDVVSKAFLGLSVACARCHDHKFDPVTMEDYYALAGYLKSSRRQHARVDSSRPTEQLRGALESTKEEVQSLLKQRWSSAPLGVPPGRKEAPATPRLPTVGLALVVGWLLIGCVWGLRSRRSARTIGVFCGAGALATSAASFAVFSGDPAPTRQPTGNSLQSFLSASAEKFVEGFADLRNAASSQEFSRRREALVDRLSEIAAAADARATDVVFEDFQSDGYDGWSVRGEAFGTGPTRAGDFLLGTSVDQPIDRFLKPGVAHSGREAGELRGTLRSKDFRVEKKYIHYRISRRPPTAPATDEAELDTGGRSGQVHLIVDGLSVNLLFSDEAVVDAHRGEQFVWYQQEIEDAWIGHRAFIEIVDNDDGFVAVDRIVFSDDPVPPPDVPGDLLIELLDDSSLVTPKRLAREVSQIFGETIQRWASGKLPASEDADDFVVLLDWLRQNGLVAAALHGTPDEAATRQTISRLLVRARALEAGIEPPQLALVTVDGTPQNEFLLNRGEHELPEREVVRRGPKLLSGSPPAEPKKGSGRLELARSLADRDNPLLGRVIVNRLWQHHFGEGIVRTPDDFGVMGEPPTHPELLDHLADELRRQQFSLKSLHREILLSSTYRMSSNHRDALANSVDQDNRLLHRMPLRRLEAEVIRDAMLAISGDHDPRMFGPGVAPHLTPFMDGRGRPDASGPLNGNGRRSIYLTVRRNFLSPMLCVFGLPMPDGPHGRREMTNVPSQALALMNNEFVLQQARCWAERVLSESHDSPEARIQRLYMMAYLRPANAVELETALVFLADSESNADTVAAEPQQWADLCHVLFNSPEFIYLR